jgi:hypothetical protein
VDDDDAGARLPELGDRLGDPTGRGAAYLEDDDVLHER